MVSDAGPFSVLATLRPSRRRIQQCKFVRPGPAENLCVQLQRLQKSLRFFTVRRQPKPRRWPQQDLRGNASGGVRHRVLRNRRQRQKSRASQHEKMFFSYCSSLPMPFHVSQGVAQQGFRPPDADSIQSVFKHATPVASQGQQETGGSTFDMIVAAEPENQE